MADTTYYGIPIPTIDADFNTWGAKNNTLHTTWDAKLASPTNTIKGKNTAGTGPHLDLTPAQVVAMLPVLNTTGRGVTPQATAADALRPLTGGAVYQKGIARAAGGLVVTTASAATLTAGSVNIASVTWGDIDSSLATVTVVFTTAMPNANYQVLLSSEYAGDTLIQAGTVNTASRTVNGFRFTYAKAFASAVSVAVFEAA